MCVEYHPQLDGVWAEANELLCHMRPKIIRYVRRQGPNSAELAEDIYQEVAALVVEKWDQVKDHPQRAAWVMKATQFLFNRHRKLESRQASLTNSLLMGDVEPAAVIIPEGLICARMDIVRAMKALTERQLKMIILYYYEDYSVTEIAEQMGIRPGTVKSTLSDARAAIRRGLE